MFISPDPVRMVVVPPALASALPLFDARKALKPPKRKDQSKSQDPGPDAGALRSDNVQFASPVPKTLLLPLTPPSNQESAETVLTPDPLGTPLLGTPLNQRSPPTPDTTPPRKAMKRPKLQTPSTRYPSSRADSFRTARENQGSSDEEGQKRLDQIRPGRVNGLGLGTEDEKEFVTFDGAWSPTSQECTPSSMRNVTLRKTSPRATDTCPAPDLERPTLRERVERNKHTPTSVSIEKFAEDIEWPSAVDDILRDSQMDEKRLSGLSSTSTIIEAVVIDSPPQRKRTLRHSGRNLALRESASPLRSTSGHRLLHKTSRIPDRSARNSSASEQSSSVTSSAGRPKVESIPVVVIPQRRSSLKSSDSSGQHSRSLSLNSARGRPTTAPEESQGYFDLPRRRSRTLSDSVTNGKPIIPARSSSLSAPTSRDASRTTSLKSVRRPEPLNLELVPHQSVQQSQSAQKQDRPAAERQMSSSKFLAALLSPFSQPSVTSSPEALEVSEAKAVSIFPHNNDSLLVIQHQARPVSKDENLPNPSITMGEPRTPPTRTDPSALVESPLKNPRKPPQPPAFKIIPPTPAVLTPAEESDKQLGAISTIQRLPTEAVKFVRPVMRRALSTRGYSDEILSPFAKYQTYHPNRKIPKKEEDENKLHPFWRPRGFWDDLETPDDEYDSNLGTSSRRRRMPFSLPHKSFSLSRRKPDSSLPRSPKRKSISSLRSASKRKSDRSLRSDGIRKSRHGMMVKAIPIPALGVQIEYIGLQGVRDKLLEKKQKRIEEKSEERREQLKKKIGTTIYAPDARVA
ncbi:MAG: hypothetical protein M1819_006598 [Sarea resinae]|nr:MAG: hypothetical protein M1819_006598 [Sarea resinae]